MTIKTGASAAKRAKRKSAYLRRIGEFQKRVQMLEEARATLAQSTTLIRSGVTGAGEESSGGQGVLGSISSQAGYNLALDRHTGETYDEINKEISAAKKSASGIKVAAIAATVVTFGAAAVAGLAAAGAAASGGAAASSAATLGGASSFSVGSFAGANAAVSVAGGTAAATGGALSAGLTAFKASYAATNFIRTGANAVANYATSYETPDPSTIGGVSIAPTKGYYGGGGGSGGGGVGYSSSSYANYNDNRISNPRSNVNTSVFYG